MVGAQCFSKIFFIEKSKPFFYQSLTKKLNSCPNFRIKDNRREAHFNSYFSSACFFGNIIRRWCAQSTPVPHPLSNMNTTTHLHPFIYRTALAHSHIDDFCIFLRRLQPTHWSPSVFGTKHRAHICKPLNAPRNRFPAWRACTVRLPYLLYSPGSLHRLAESIPKPLKRLQIRAQAMVPDFGTKR